jgi:hypothetical protein
MIGGTINPDKSSTQTQTFIMSLNSKVRPPVFKTTYWVDKERASLEAPYLSDARIRGVRTYVDNYQGQDIPKFEIQFYAKDNPLVDVDGNQVKDQRVRNVYKVQGSFSLKGRELLNNVAGAIMDGQNTVSISIKKAFKQNPQTKKYDVPVTDKKGDQVYNVLVFVPKEGGSVTKQMPLFANADFCDHPRKDEYVKAENMCSEAESGKPLAKFWQEFIKTDLQKAAFELYQKDMEAEGITVEVEDWDEYKLKHILPDSTEKNASVDGFDETEDPSSDEPVPAGEVDDDLPF